MKKKNEEKENKKNLGDREPTILWEVTTNSDLVKITDKKQKKNKKKKEEKKKKKKKTKKQRNVENTAQGKTHTHAHINQIITPNGLPETVDVRIAAMGGTAKNSMRRALTSQMRHFEERSSTKPV
jgi:hypothetical protein